MNTDIKKTTRIHMLMCFGTGCVSSGAEKVREALVRELAGPRPDDKAGRGRRPATTASTPARWPWSRPAATASAPAARSMVVYPGGYFYQKLTPEDMPELVEEHILKGRPVERLMYRHPVTQEVIPHYADIPFFSPRTCASCTTRADLGHQHRGVHRPRRLLRRWPRPSLEMTPEQIIEEMKKSGLRGRGGAGFPTGMKWEFAAQGAGEPEVRPLQRRRGRPGRLHGPQRAGGRSARGHRGDDDRRARHRRPEGLHLLPRRVPAGHRAAGAGHRAAPRARACWARTSSARTSTSTSTMAQGSGAFVCGEETALMRSIEGKRGEPRPRPPFPASQGPLGQADGPQQRRDLRQRAPHHRQGGGLVPLRGHREEPGHQDLRPDRQGEQRRPGRGAPWACTLGEIIYDIGGGIPDGKEFKAAQIGGPSGGCIPKEYLNVPMDYESLTELGAIMGSGGLIVMDEDSCMVDMARFFLEFIAGRVLRQVHAVPDRHQADAGDPGPHLRRQGARTGTSSG